MAESGTVGRGGHGNGGPAGVSAHCLFTGTTEFPGGGEPRPPAGLVVIHPAAATAGEDGDPAVTVARDPMTGEHWFLYADGCRFRVSASGDRVTAGGPPEMTREDLDVYLTGPIQGLVLRLQGVVSLHASAVELDGRAVAFAGGGGAGKSTLAAQLALGGSAVVTDDILALEETAAGFHARPVAGPLKLWPDSVARLLGRAEALPRLVPSSPDWDKRRLNHGVAGVNFAGEPLPLAVVYLLETRAAATAPPGAESVPPAAALVELTAHSYVNYALSPEMRAHEFAVLGRLVRTVPVRRLRLPEAGGDRPGPREFLRRDAAAAAGMAG